MPKHPPLKDDIMGSISHKLSEIKESHQYRSSYTITKLDATTVQIKDQILTNFCSNDYLNMSSHPELIAHHTRAIERHGLSSSSSHLVSGHTNAHQELEDYLCKYLGVEKVLLFSTGYMANMGVLSALRDDIEWILQDKLNHASLIDANMLIGKPVSRYLHTNIDSLEQKLRRKQGNGLIITDTIFSMDGDIANINELYAHTIDKPITLMQDDAHGFGIYPPIIPKDSLYMATFGKAIGLHGACVAGSKEMLEYMVQKSRPYIYTTALSPATALSVKKSLELIHLGDKVAKLEENIQLFKSHIHTSSTTAIQPILIGDNEKAMRLEQELFAKGLYVKAIRPPTVPQAILRVTLNAEHSHDDIMRLTGMLQ